MDFAPEEFATAWQSIRTGGKAPGLDDVSLAAFAQKADAHLSAIRRDLRAGLYTPTGYRTVLIPKPTRGFRPIQIATFRDRIVQRLLLNRLQPVVEAVSLPSSFAYRPEIGVDQALLAVRAAREAGFTHVLEADVKDCFESIRLEVLGQNLWDLGLDCELIDLILQCITAGGPDRPASSDCEGLPQGAVLSPTLCNLVLTHLDRRLHRPHRRLVRYADDLIVLCQSERACHSAQREVEEALTEIGLELNPRKTAFSDFQRGFNYLGARFIGTFIIPESPAPYTRGPAHLHELPTIKRRSRRKLEYIF